MAAEKSSVPRVHSPTEDLDDTLEAHYSCLERFAPPRLHGQLGVRRLHRRAGRGAGSVLSVPPLRDWATLIFTENGGSRERRSPISPSLG